MCFRRFLEIVETENHQLYFKITSIENHLGENIFYFSSSLSPKSNNKPQSQQQQQQTTCDAYDIPNTSPRPLQNKGSRCVLPLKHVAQGYKAQREGHGYEEVLGQRSVRVCQLFHVSPGHTWGEPARYVPPREKSSALLVRPWHKFCVA